MQSDTPHSNTALVRELIHSYSRQLAWYEELNTLAGRTLNALILPRGRPVNVLSQFSRKQELLNAIVLERDRTAGEIGRWQAGKHTIPDSPEKRNLIDILSRTEIMIKEFLLNEEQIKVHLQRAMHAGETAAHE